MHKPSTHAPPHTPRLTQARHWHPHACVHAASPVLLVRTPQGRAAAGVQCPGRDVDVPHQQNAPALAQGVHYARLQCLGVCAERAQEGGGRWCKVASCSADVPLRQHAPALAQGVCAGERDCIPADLVLGIGTSRIWFREPACGAARARDDSPHKGLQGGPSRLLPTEASLFQRGGCKVGHAPRAPQGLNHFYF